MKLGLRELVFIAAMLGILGASYFVGFNRQNLKRQAKIEQRDAKLRGLSELDQTSVAGKDMDKKVGELQKAITYFESRLPQAKEMDKVLKEIWQLAEQNGLRTQTIKTPKSQRMNGYSEQTVELNLSGEFKPGFYEFMLKLEQLPRLTRVTKMNLTKIQEKDGEMQASLTMSIFFEPDTEGPVASSR
jgi:Tfp pilus assembly protein PilO